MKDTKHGIHLKNIDYGWIDSFYNNLKLMTVSQIIGKHNSLDPKRGKKLLVR